MGDRSSPSDAGLEIAQRTPEEACGQKLARKTKQADKNKLVSLFAENWSEYKDSNLGPPGPKPGALPGCATLRRGKIITAGFAVVKGVRKYKKL